MSKNSSHNEPAGWGLRLAALALTLLGIVVVFAFRFADNGNQPSAIMWAGVPVVGGLLAGFLLGKIKRFGSQKRKWEIYTYVLVLASIGILVKTWFF